MEFKENSELRPLQWEHFPTRLQAVIWRNWELVSAERLALALGTTAERIVELARDLGLRVPAQVEENWLNRGYITIIRANWHLLPFTQLLTLLDWSPEQMNFALKEDDFLWFKLGNQKPGADPVSYRPLTPEEQERTADFRRTIGKHMPQPYRSDEARPFDFLAPFLSAAPFMAGNVPAEPMQPTEVAMDNSWGLASSLVSPRMEKIVQRFHAALQSRWGLTLARQAADGGAAIRFQLQPDAALLAESHRIEIDSRHIRITAVDEAGLMRGLQWLEARMEQRGAPYLPMGTFHRKTNFDVRFIYSYFAVYGDPLLDSTLDPYPDEWLARLSKQGINGIWLQAVLYTMVPWPEAPHLSAGWETRVANLRALTARAADYGIGVYLYCNEPRALPLSFFDSHPAWKGHVDQGQAALCTSVPAVRDWLRASVARLFQEVPDLAGLFTITMSENLTNCYSLARDGKTNCPRCAQRTPQEIVAEVNGLIEEGVRSASATARVLGWTWGWNPAFGWDMDRIKETIERLPDTVSVMCTSEEAIPTNIGGVAGQVSEYAISVVGPGEKARAIWELARSRRMPGVAKVQFNNTWEHSAVPYIPTLDLVEQHVRGLLAAGVSGLMLSWTLGGYPSLNLELASAFYWGEEEERGNETEALIQRVFGAAAFPVREAVASFSRAFRHYPYSIGVLYHAPHHKGPSNLLYMQPTGYQACMVGEPYDDLERWRWIYPADVFEQQFYKLACEWAEGVAVLKSGEWLLDGSPASARLQWQDLAHVAEATYCHFRSAYLQIRFVRLRDQLLAAEGHEGQSALAGQMEPVVAEELALAKQLYGIRQRDSRIGFEASNHYYYTQQDLLEKVVNCEQVWKQLKSLQANRSG